MTTVGYGDMTPKTPEGKAIAITVMLVGIGFATLVIGAAAKRFVSPPADKPELLTDAELLTQVSDISVRLKRIEDALQHQRSSAEVGV
jgi:voltage-gated potassium channel